MLYVSICGGDCHPISYDRFDCNNEWILFSIINQRTIISYIYIPNQGVYLKYSDFRLRLCRSVIHISYDLEILQSQQVIPDSQSIKWVYYLQYIFLCHADVLS